MSFDMLLQVLGPFEGLPTKVASMRLQRYMDTDVRGDVVAFYNGNAAATPRTSEIEVVSAFTSDMGLADMILLVFVSRSLLSHGGVRATYIELFSISSTLVAAHPLA